MSLRRRLRAAVGGLPGMSTIQKVVGKDPIAQKVLKVDPLARQFAMDHGLVAQSQPQAAAPQAQAPVAQPGPQQPINNQSLQRVRAMRERFAKPGWSSAMPAPAAASPNPSDMVIGHAAIDQWGRTAYTGFNPDVPPPGAAARGDLPGLDQNAINADPAGFAAWRQGAAAQEAARPGSTYLSQVRGGVAANTTPGVPPAMSTTAQPITPAPAVSATPPAVPQAPAQQVTSSGSGTSWADRMMRMRNRSSVGGGSAMPGAGTKRIAIGSMPANPAADDVAAYTKAWSAQP